jgi:hypothetical protein
MWVRVLDRPHSPGGEVRMFCVNHVVERSTADIRLLAIKAAVERAFARQVLCLREP